MTCNKKNFPSQGGETYPEKDGSATPRRVCTLQGEVCKIEERVRIRRTREWRRQSVLSWIKKSLPGEPPCRKKKAFTS
jgi:hypothetical protein